MRKIMGTKHCSQDGELESWVDWIVRATRAAEVASVEHNVPDWVEEVHRRRYKWARKVATCEDGRWTKEILLLNVGGKRPRRRPLTRWSESFARFLEHAYGSRDGPQEWMRLAQCEETWSALEADYLNFTLSR